MSIPKTMEDYYQEMNRAGRDWLKSEVLLLHSMQSFGLLWCFIVNIENESYRNIAYQKFSLIKKYAFFKIVDIKHSVIILMTKYPNAKPNVIVVLTLTLTLTLMLSVAILASK